MNFKFVPLDFDYRDINGKEVIRIFGRTEDGKKCIILDNLKAYFFVLPKDGVDLKELSDKISCIELRNAGRTAKVSEVSIENKRFMGKDIKALRVFVENHKDI